MNYFVKVNVLFCLLLLFVFEIEAQEIGKSWEFNDDDNFEGIIIGTNFESPVVSNGSFKATVSNVYPSLYSEPFELDADDFGFFQIKIKIPGATSGKIMWNNDSGEYGYYRFYTPGDSAFHEYDIPVYLSEKWTGKITKILRLDFNPDPGSVVEIDYIRIVRLGPKANIVNFSPLRTIFKHAAEIPIVAVVKNDGDVKASFSSKLELPSGATLINGTTEQNHGILFKEISDTLNWSIQFNDLGDYDISLKLYTESDTSEKIYSFQVTDIFWQPDKFLLSSWSPPYAWYGPPYEDSVFVYYKNANFDNVLWARDDDVLIDKVHQFGLQYYLLVTPIFGDTYLRAPDETIPPDITEEMLLKLDAAIEKYKDDPDLLGYHICDEPHREAFPNIAKVVSRIREKDPERLSFVNIWPSGSEYQEYIDDLLQTCKLELLSYDRYHFFNNYDGGSYFSNLEIIRKNALKYDIPFCNIIQAIGTNNTSESQLDWRTPTEAEHRWLVYSSLAYGVHGLIWFHWHLDWGVTGNPDRDIIYPSIQNINAEIDSLSQIMLCLKTTNVYHTKTAIDKWRLPIDGIIKSVSNNADLVVGYFKGQKDDDYVMLMNKNYKSGITTDVTLNYDLDSLQVFDVNENRWEQFEFENGDGGATFNIQLRAGGGKLFKFKAELAATVSNAIEVPVKFELEQNYPNPFNPGTTIRYTVPGGLNSDLSSLKVTLSIYDILGRKVATLINKKQKAGKYEIKFNINTRPVQIASGIYFYRLDVGPYSQTRKMMFIQ